ncbi:YfaQ family protein [Caldimonas brevitalea]|uniref:Signal peptide protein n=1 Tax=Caldimonas brevitalea TaxID=413882 RepID=A0A0G3BPJ9_9BURK|nr:DUF2300 domain-containing protein [Caldimonas brevitalea]AKJ29913.1 signal peptide protein [Caldimonas brevitalea]
MRRNHVRTDHAPFAGVWRVATAALLAGALLSAAHAREPGPGELQLAWLDAAGEVQAVTLRADGSASTTRVEDLGPTSGVALGSLWKLVSYARLAEGAAREPEYRCQGGRPDEVYCCNPGQQIGRGTALWRSCGLYFDATRVQWDRLPPGGALGALPPSMAALQQGRHLDEHQRVPLRDWLSWLGQWPAPVRQQAQDDLLGYWLQGPGRAVLGQVGSRLRVKTFTMAREEAGGQGQRWAGASGWTGEGTPIWMAARGTSAQVLPTWAARVLQHLDGEGLRAAPSLGQVATDASDATCVRVDYFSRYPIARLHPEPSQQGVLPAGHYRVQFANGQRLSIESRRDLRWSRGDDGRVRLEGRLTLEDYVARVVEREGRAEPAAAAQALAVAARTYVLARGRPDAGCLAIADSSALQRVAPRPPSRGARAAATYTAGLVLKGAEGRYHSSQAAPNVMSWADSVRAAEAGERFDELLRHAYPQAALTARAGAAGSSCEALPLAEHWLTTRRAVWQRMLAGEPGYAPPAQVRVCRLAGGRPHALRAAGRLYVSGVQSLEERLTLTHEYLHLAFSGHPRSADESFIERLARRLLGLDDEGAS